MRRPRPHDSLGEALRRAVFDAILWTLWAIAALILMHWSTAAGHGNIQHGESVRDHYYHQEIQP